MLVVLSGLSFLGLLVVFWAEGGLSSFVVGRSVHVLLFIRRCTGLDSIPWVGVFR